MHSSCKRGKLLQAEGPATLKPDSVVIIVNYHVSGGDHFDKLMVLKIVAFIFGNYCQYSDISLFSFSSMFDV